MRTRQSILAIILAIACISCQPVGGVAPPPPSAAVPCPVEPPKALPAPAKKASSPAPAATGMKPIIAPVRTGVLSPPGQKGFVGGPAPSPSGRQHIVLNFDKADVAEVTSQIFSDQLKLSYVLDQTLQGRISMYIEGDFNNEELLNMIMKAYADNGISIIPKRGFYFITLSRGAAGAGIPVAGASQLQRPGGGPVIIIYRLRYIDAKQASELISPFVTPGQRVTIDPATNSVVFVEQGSNAHTLIGLLKTIDINVLKEVSMAVLPLHSISPKEAVEGMKNLMGQLGKFKQSAIASSLALLPLENFGGVLIMARSPELLRTAQEWIKAMDAQGIGNQEQIYVYFVQNGMASDIAQIVAQVLGISTGQVGKAQKVVPSGTAAKSAFGGGGLGGGGGSSPFGGGGSSGAGGFGSMGGSSIGGGSTTTSGGGQEIGTAMKGKPPGFTGQISIIADDVNNAIVMRANRVDYTKLMETIKRLDIVPRAVLIEVMIAEVELNKQFQYGLQYYFQTHAKTNTGFGTSFGGLSNQGTNSSSTTSTTTTTGAFPINLGAISGAGIALDWVANSQNLAVLLSAISARTNVSVLSTPTLLATDNQEATLTVGGEQPVPTGSVTGYTTGSSVISTIDYAQTGVILDITPHINAGGLIRLDLDSTVRRVNQQNVAVGSNNTTAPTFTERHIKTSILAQNGRTVVIGGIIDSQGTQGKSGIPWLENIPLLSPLFAGRTSTLDRVELLIAITPHVVEKSGTQAPAELLEKLRNLRQEVGY
jgi:general secretion pathway protein D